MKSLLKIAVLSSLMVFASCGHHGKKHHGCGAGQCHMKEGGKDCKECEMKKEATEEKAVTK